MAIAAAVEAELGNRKGERTDLGPEVPKGETRDIAAAASGFGSGKTLDRAKVVAYRGWNCALMSISLANTRPGSHAG